MGCHLMRSCLSEGVGIHAQEMHFRAAALLLAVMTDVHVIRGWGMPAAIQLI